MVNYPGSLDSFVNPATTDTQNNPPHATQHADANDAIEAVEAKVGTGSSTPASNTLLVGTGAGTSAWQSLTSAELAARVSDETGTGALVFATSPTITTPTIGSFTNANHDHTNSAGGGALGANTVNTTQIVDSAVTNQKLSTSTGELGGSWQNFTPTYTSFTLGNGTLTYAKYTKIGKTVFFRFAVVLGSTSTVGADPGFLAPVTPASDYVKNDYEAVGLAGYLDSGSNFRNGPALLSASDYIKFFTWGTDNALRTSINSTTPFTWAVNDRLTISGSYESS